MRMAVIVTKCTAAGRMLALLGLPFAPRTDGMRGAGAAGRPRDRRARADARPPSSVSCVGEGRFAAAAARCPPLDLD